MAISYDLLDERLLATLPDFSSQVWGFPHDHFLRWFFVDVPDNAFVVAHDDGRWLAAIGGIGRRYAHMGNAVDCFETYAWASLRTAASKGLGIKVMKRLAAIGRPLIALGGSVDTLNYMPRMGFETVAQAPSMVLPLSGASFRRIGGAKGRLLRLGITLAAPLLRPRPKGAGGVRCVPMTRFDQPLLDRSGLPGFQALYDAAFFEWQDGYAEQGQFLPLRFMRDEEVVGWIFARVAEEEDGMLVGRILETRFMPASDAPARKAMLAMACAAMIGYGVTEIRALTTCPETNAGLSDLRFRHRTLSPAMIFTQGLAFGAEPVRVSVLRADGGVLPLATPEQIAVLRAPSRAAA